MGKTVLFKNEYFIFFQEEPFKNEVNIEVLIDDSFV